MRVQHMGLKVGVIIGFTLFCLAVFVFLYTQAGGQLRLSSPYTVKAVVPEPINLVENSDVRLGGVKVGRVVGRDNQGSNGVVEFEIEDEHAPMYRDGTVKPRIKTLVGETYLEIDPGNPKSGKVEDGETIAIAQAEEVVPLERILSTFDAETRREIRRNLQSLGGGFDDRGDDLNRLFATMRPTVADGGRLMSALRGQRRQLASAIDDTAKVLQAFGDRSAQVRTLATQAKNAAQAAASRDDQVEEIFRELPPTLTQARATLDDSGSFSSKATPVMRDLRLSFADLEPVMRDLEPAAADTRKVFRALPSFIDRANPLLSALRPFSGALSPAVKSLESVLREAAPTVDFLKQYDREFGSFFANIGSGVDVRDALGNLGRVHAVAGPTSLDDFAANPQLLAAYKALIKAGVVELVAENDVNHYPKAGTLAAPNAEQAFENVQPAK